MLVGGLPGTGKTSLSEALGDRLGFTVLSSDRVRKELAELPPETSATARYGTGIYDAAWTHRTYTALLERAARLLSYGDSVILDASWTSASLRAEATEMAGSADVIALNCSTPLAAERLRTRPHGVSDADPQIAAQMADSADPWPEAVTVETSGPVGESVEQALRAVRPFGAGHVWHHRSMMSPD